MDLFKSQENKTANTNQITDSDVPDNMDSIARKWRLLSGEENWEGLLYPLDYDLRRYIIHYGEMAQSTYDTFNIEKASKYAGNCIFSMDDLFAHAGLQFNANPFKYNVTKYLFATSSVPMPDAFIFKSLSREAWSKESNWIGYVAVATDEGKVALGRRDIVIAWRGSIRGLEWIDDFDFKLEPAPIIFEEKDGTKVHQGWYSMYTSIDPKSPFTKTSARDQVLGEIQRLLKLYKEEEISITITGHSLGAAIGTLNAVDIVKNRFNKPDPDSGNKTCPVTAIIYGCPRVGDQSFANAVSHLHELHILRIRNALDIITWVPLIAYTEVGKELTIDTTKSTYLKRPGNVLTWHNLEAYMHGVAGTQGHGEAFELVIHRDISLVNKIDDIVKDEYCVPVGWWCLKNKGMVQQENGAWKLRDHMWLSD